MALRSCWAVVDANIANKIIFIEDICHLTGGMSITNDAHNVLSYFHRQYGIDWRVVYKDTLGDWSEIVLIETWTQDSISFEPWHGIMWDTLKR